MRRKWIFEVLEQRQLLAADWQNPLFSFDINLDGSLSPIDALIGINALNQNGGGVLDAPRSNGDPYLDTNGDGSHSPIDPLIVINALNQGFEIPIQLQEGAKALVEKEITIGVGQEIGRRNYRFEVQTDFDHSDSTAFIEDTLAVFLRNPSTDQTLLDRGSPNTSLIALSETQTDLAIGRARFDGRFVDLDLTDVTNVESAQLVFQLINADGDAGSRVSIIPVANTVDLAGRAGPVLEQPTAIAPTQSPVDFAQFVQESQLEIEVTNVRVDSSDAFSADLRLRNVGAPIGRAAVLEITNLPAGVELIGAAGDSPSGNPYLNLRDSIPFGGLDTNATTLPIHLKLANPHAQRFALDAQIWVGPDNQPPVLATVDPISIMPGDLLIVDLEASDPDGDAIRFDMANMETMPPISLSGNGKLTLAPVPGDEGNYTFDVLATDGRSTVSQAVFIDVIPDAVTTTRLSGIILDTHEAPIPGITIALGSLQTQTAPDGTFFLETAGNLDSDTLRIHGEEYVGDSVFPFIAEKLPLLFGRDAIPGIHNVVTRPIYLPALDIANGQTIDPVNDTLVTTETIPGASVFVEGGTLLDQSGDPFSGTLSITEVPPELTPAALPPDLFPDVVVTIQPGEMVFTQPAPISFPNSLGWAPGTVMDLWSINPVTGEFEVVGDMRVSEDGTTIDTVHGGIRSSSWHFSSPRPFEEGQVVPPSEDSFNQDEGCRAFDGSCSATSQVLMHSGTLTENHELVTYHSQGRDRGVVLTYDSLRADPRPSIGFSLNSSSRRAAGNRDRLVGTLDLLRDGVKYQVLGSTETLSGLPPGAFVWRYPEIEGASNPVRIAVQADLRNQASGRIDYELSVGQFLQDGNRFGGATESQTGQIIHVNSIGSPFGNGWGVSGLQHLVENPDGSVLLVDGNGEQLIYEADETSPVFQSPAGDFSRFERLVDGTYQRTMRDQTRYHFDAQNRIRTKTDRNGSQTTYAYDAAGNLSSITDPVGLVTSFTYVAERVSQITDPAGRVTQLFYDAAGNLQSIIDPDNSSRTFEYDNDHRMIGETDKRGFREQIFYDAAGRVSSVILKDGTSRQYSVVQNAQVIQSQPINDLVDGLPVASDSIETEAIFVDRNGAIITMDLDQAGQVVAQRDGIGPLPRVLRNADNLVSTSITARGHRTTYEYDERGNLIAQHENLDSSDRALSFPAQFIADGEKILVADVNNDGLLDGISTKFSQNDVLISLADAALRFTPAVPFPVGDSPFEFTVLDANGDGNLDIATANFSDESVSLLLGDGTGKFPNREDFAVGQNPTAIAAGDLNNDGFEDAITISFDDTASVLLSNALGQLQVSTFDLPQAQTIHLADVNADEHLDLVAPLANDRVHVALGNGDGTFLVGSEHAAGDEPIDVTSADFDLDGALDLAIANSASGGVTILFGDGTGNYPRQTFVDTNQNPRRVESGDMNGDGIPDILSSTFGSLVVLFGAKDGNLMAQPSIRIGEIQQVTDLDGDDSLDVVAVNLGKATAHFGNSETVLGQRERFVAGFRSTSATSGDFNQDGVLDLVTTGRLSTDSRILLGRPQGGFDDAEFIQVGNTPEHVIRADLNNDGQLDLAVAGELTYVVPGNGDGTFAEAMRQGSAKPTFIQAGDLNQDGSLDLATANPLEGNVSLFLSGPQEFVYSEIRIGVGQEPIALQLADFNGDRALDVLTSDANDNRLSILMLDSEGLPIQNIAIDAGGKTAGLVARDFDGDGEQDIAALRTDDNSLLVMRGVGGGEFEAPIVYPIPGSALPLKTVLSAEDLNADGQEELMLLHDEAVLIFVGRPEGRFDQVRMFEALNGSYVLPTDANHDGTTDLVVLHENFDFVSVLSGGAAASQRWTWDPVFSVPTSYTDELGRETLFEVDNGGNTVSVTRVVGQRDGISGESDDVVSQFTYNSSGLLATEQDALGRVTLYEYDSLGRRTATTEAAGTPDETTKRFEYDGHGNLSAVVDGNGNRSQFVYDTMNRLVEQRSADPDGAGPLNESVATFSYDANGSLLDTVGVAGSRTRFTYDALNRPIRTEDDEGKTVSYVYDASGNLIQTTDEQGRITERSYDQRNRITQLLRPDGSTLQFGYDLDDNQNLLVDAIGNETRLLFDGRNRLVRRLDASGRSTVAKYDAANQLLEVIDRNQRTTRMSYDDLGRKTREIWLSEQQGTRNELTYEYDAVGNLLRVVDDSSDLTFVYDALDRAVVELVHGTPGAPSLELTYSYDAASNVIEAVDSVNGIQLANTSISYDNLNRVTSITTSGNAVAEKRVEFDFNTRNQFTTIERYSDAAGTTLVASTDFTYDGLNRLTSIDHVGSALLANYDLEYDALDRIASIDSMDGLTQFSYDAQDQLVATVYASASLDDESYNYDANGNRVTEGTTVLGAGNRVLQDADFDYRYDAEGNLVLRTARSDRTVRRFEYDHRNRLIVVSDTDSAGESLLHVVYTYDSLNRRTLKEVESPGTSEATYFLYDRDNVLLEYFDGDGTSGPSEPQPSQRYLHGPAIDQVLAQESAGGDVQWLLADHLGTIRDVIDNNGQVVNHLAYDSFGNLISQTDATNGIRFGLAGREYDAEIDLYYNRARYYNPVSGRFLSEDPIQESSGELNFYRYVFNMPNMLRDPSGLGIKDFISDLFDKAKNKVRDKIKEKIDSFFEPARKRVAPLEEAMDIVSKVAERNNETDPVKRRQLEEGFVERSKRGTKDKIRDALIDGVTAPFGDTVDRARGFEDPSVGVGSRVSEFTFRGCGNR